MTAEKPAKMQAIGWVKNDSPSARPMKGGTGSIPGQGTKILMLHGVAKRF